MHQDDLVLCLQILLCSRQLQNPALLLYVMYLMEKFPGRKYYILQITLDDKDKKNTELILLPHIYSILVLNKLILKTYINIC